VGYRLLYWEIVSSLMVNRLRVGNRQLLPGYRLRGKSSSFNIRYHLHTILYRLLAPGIVFYSIYNIVFILYCIVFLHLVLSSIQYTVSSPVGIEVFNTYIIE
jgi:hypothetical protein